WSTLLSIAEMYAAIAQRPDPMLSTELPPEIGAKPSTAAPALGGWPLGVLPPLGGSAAIVCNCRARGDHERLTRVVHRDDQLGGGPHRPRPGHAPFRAHPVQRSRTRSRRAG